MDGEKTGTKKSPEEVEISIRKKLQPQQYVTSAQIRSLFSTFKMQLKKGNLKAPGKKSGNKGQQNDEGVEGKEEIKGKTMKRKMEATILIFQRKYSE